MRVLAIDPGSAESAYVLWDGHLGFNRVKNDELRHFLRDSQWPHDVLVIELFRGMGMICGKEVFDACIWSGRFAECSQAEHVVWIPRQDVKLHICGDSRAKDANIRAALIDRFGGKPAIKKGGALHGVSKDCWSALALALTFWDNQKRYLPEPNLGHLEPQEEVWP